MLVFIVRRLIVSVFVFFSATALVYVMAANLGDPLADLRELPANRRENAIAERTERMHLDKPVIVRYFLWLAGAFRWDLGTDRDGIQINATLEDALGATLQLVLGATILAIVLGVALGVISALRQYSSLDLTVTFSAFVFFSLPLFWVGSLLKEFAAIEFNNWLADPTIAWWVIALIALLIGGFFASLLVTDRRTRLIAFGGTTAATAVALAVMSATGWFANPGLGIGVIALTALAAALGFSVLFSALEWNPVMKSAVITAVIGILSSVAFRGVLENPYPIVVIGLLVLALAIAAGVGWFVGGELFRRPAITASLCTAVATAMVIFMDRLLWSFAAYSDSVNGRPIATIGPSTPNYDGTYWEHNLDSLTHLALPTMALVLVSLASYSRYSRATMLEVMNQDYVRTARAKGLPERAVILRHAFRNGLIPITTLVAYDIATVFGGAVVTETVFGWRAMGSLLLGGIQERDPNPIMAFFLISGGAVVVFNMIADIAYAYLDPRIRLS
ncbi:ABC transporter permease [Streptomyces aidingensis]|uniref:Peptide/nickel transport system permease protein n=1 Tax=Streptomyces aidingensis TaxID=910347 RepID=A0A1I1QDX1_9ACTN|nr:ABC transporter permease [Streptomyces aidingensis]SFD16330.1 peptide/nickel transport system permease protein [Streptomyces aidingensis]